MKNCQIFIFTDLDGSLLNHNNFEFKEIKDFILDCIKNGIKIIPNTSKTNSEIQVFLDQLGQNLPFIVENGAAIHNLDLVHPKIKVKNNSLVFSRSLPEILKLFEKNIPKDFQKRCFFLKDMSSIEQMKILGLNKKYLPFALNRDYSIPLVFEGSKEIVNEFTSLLKEIGMKLHEGGRIYNICDDCSKGKAMITLIEKLKNEFDFNSHTIVVGDSPNDISMLNVSDQPCIIPLPNKKNLFHLKDKKIIRATQTAPQGWEEVVRASLKKINFELEG
jgi:mannosyl-3-phosphoglycerate phosphatase family protein